MRNLGKGGRAQSEFRMRKEVEGLLRKTQTSYLRFSWGSAPSFLGSTISLSITSPLAQGFSAQEDHG